MQWFRSYAKPLVSVGLMLVALIIWTLYLGPYVQQYALERDEWRLDKEFLRAARVQAMRQVQAQQEETQKRQRQTVEQQRQAEPQAPDSSGQQRTRGQK